MVLKLARLLSEEFPSYTTCVLAVSSLLLCGAIYISSDLVGKILPCLATQAHTEHMVLERMVVRNTQVLHREVHNTQDPNRISGHN